LAEKADIHRTYIGSVERGERNISIDNIIVIAHALNVQLADHDNEYHRADAQDFLEIPK
jgi:transcriptional regulator with XRE-family HTH domain